MSALDDAVAELEARRAKDEAERRGRLERAKAFLTEFFEADLRPSRALREHGIEVAFDGRRILLQKPAEGIYAEGMMIVIGEQGEIDVSGKSVGPVQAGDRDARRKELIAEIIAHFSL